MLPLFQFIVGAFTDLCSRACEIANTKYSAFSCIRIELDRPTAVFLKIKVFDGYMSR